VDTGGGIALALLAALLFAAAAVAQQSAASSLPDAKGVDLLRALVRRPLWLVGTGGDFLGFVAQAAALGVGALVLVQPLLVTTLLFALPLGAWWAGRRVRRADVGWAVVLAVALAVFVVVGEPTAGVDRAAAGRWLPVLGVLAVLVVVCLVGAAVRRGAVRAVLLSVGTAVGYGLAAALTTTVVSLLDDGVLAVVTAWETWTLVVVAVGATWLQQVAFSSGDLAASLPTITVGEPLVGALLGVIVLGERLTDDGPGALAVIAVVLAVTVVAVVVLARTSARQTPSPAPVGRSAASDPPDGPEPRASAASGGTDVPDPHRAAVATDDGTDAPDPHRAAVATDGRSTMGGRNTGGIDDEDPRGEIQEGGRR
jgi:drug/metabolite transporter (DMT)-like permease